MTTEQSMREQNDVLRQRIRECLEANARVNLVIASMADEQARLTAVVLRVTTAGTLRYLQANPEGEYPLPDPNSKSIPA